MSTIPPPFSEGIERRLKTEEAKANTRHRPMPGADRERTRAIATRARLDRERARQVTRECQMPDCHSQPLRYEGKSLGICFRCGLDVADYFQRLDETPELTARQATRRINALEMCRREERVKESAAIAPGWIYYLLISGRIKIGYSTDVKRRLRSYPPDSPLLALHPGTKTLEHEMHLKFTGSRAAGREWFLDTEELRHHITTVIDQFGEPDRARYEHRGQHKNPLGKVS